MDARLDERHSVQSRQALRELGVKRIRFRMDLSGRPTASWTPHTTRRPVRSDLAMTGEISPRGKVLPVGGIKEKVLAAHRVGIREVILPRRNQRDIEDIPEELRKELPSCWSTTLRGSSPPCPHARLGEHPWCCEMKQRWLRPQHLCSKGTSR